MSKTITRFSKYFLIGFFTFLFDLFLLYFLTDFLSINYLISTGLAFLIAVSINYYFSRRFVFSKTTREVNQGYCIFLGITGAGLIIVVLLMAILVERTNLDYLSARVIVAGIVGVCNYLINLFFTFKVAGKH